MSKLSVIPYEARYRDQAIELAREMVRDSAYGDMPFDGEKVLDQVAGPFSTGANYYCRIVVRDGELYGAFIGMIFRSLFCDQMIAKDIGWWVRKERRGSAAAILLLKGFEAWAIGLGAVKIMIGQASGIDIEKTTRLYEHCGYRVVGYNTMKGVGHG